MARLGSPHQLRQRQSRVERHRRVFEIAKKGHKTELRFSHVGLVPAIECYGKCEGAWGYYINDSLRALITTGEGDANAEE